MAGVGDACAFTVDPSRIPVGFFDHVPTPEPTPEKAKARSKPRRKGPSDTTNQPPRKRSKTDAADGEENAKPPKPPTKRELAARAKTEKEAARLAAEAAKPKIKWPLLTSLTEFPRSADFATPAVSEFTLPFDVRREGKPPHYDRVNRSVWVSSAAPRPFPRDEVEACLCQPAPEVAVAMLAARETAEAAAAAKREGEGERRRRRRERGIGRDWVGKRGGGSGCVAGKVRGGRGSGCLRRGGGRSGADGLRRGVFQSFVPHDVRPARVSLRALVQQPAVSSADVAEDEDRADGASRVGSLRDGARESGAFRRRVHRGDYRRQDDGTAPVGG